MKDHFSYGFASGAIAGLLPLVINLGTRALKLNTLVWADFMGALILGRSPEETLESIFLIIIQFGFLGLWGGVFALLPPLVTSKRYLFKGAVYGGSLWYVLFSLPRMFQIPLGSEEIPLKSAVVNLVSALIWGTVMGFIDAFILGYLFGKLYNRFAE